jgi:hypothetical protein
MITSAVAHAEEEHKTQGKSLELAQQVLSRCKISSNTMITSAVTHAATLITSAVTHAATLFKNHLLDRGVEILRKDFIIDDTMRETLVTSAYNATQDCVFI